MPLIAQKSGTLITSNLEKVVQNHRQTKKNCDNTNVDVHESLFRNKDKWLEVLQQWLLVQVCTM